MNKKIITGLIVTGITGMGSAIAALAINKINKKQLDRVEVKEEIKEEVKEEIKEEVKQENDEQEKIIIDDSDIEI